MINCLKLRYTSTVLIIITFIKFSTFCDRGMGLLRIASVIMTYHGDVLQYHCATTLW